MYIQDVAAMETNDSYASAVSKDFQAPNFENPPGVMTSAGFIQTPLSLQPPNTTANLPTQEAGSNATTPRGQQKKASRFLLEMPQLSMPRPRPVTNTTPANPRAQVTITRPTSLSQVVASTNQRRVAQLQMPSLHTPSRPKLPTTSTIHHTAIGSTSSHIYNTSLTVSKPSLQISKPAQVELTRPMTHQATNKNITETQQGSNAMLCMPQLQQQQTGSPSTEMVENEVASQQNGVTDSNATATDMPQEMQAGDKNNASDMHQDASNVSNINKEGESLNGDDIMGTSRGEESSVFNAADVQIQQPLTSTAPVQQAITTSMIALNTNTASMIEANAMEMADPSITSYSGPTFTGFNEAPQQMDTTNSDSNSSQDPAATAEGVYSMYGAEMYQQPNPQMQMVK